MFCPLLPLPLLRNIEEENCLLECNYQLLLIHGVLGMDVLLMSRKIALCVLCLGCEAETPYQEGEGNLVMFLASTPHEIK